MNWKQTYKSKLVSVEQAASKIQSGDKCWISACTSAPVHLVEAIGKRYDELENVDMVTGIAMYPYKFLQSPAYVGKINYHTIFSGAFERVFSRFGNVSVNSGHFSNIAKSLNEIYGLNVLLADVSIPDEEGYLHYGPMGVSLNGMVADNAEKVIVQVNKFQPQVTGMKHRIHVDDVDWICEKDHMLPIFPQSEASDTDNKIAEQIIPLIPDGATIQIGVGGLSNAVGYKLDIKKDLSIHTEMLTDSMVYLANKGVVTGKIVSGFALGNREVNDFAAAGKVELVPTAIANDPYEIAKNDNFISINACLMTDLTGQVCAESIGFRQYSCTGGQADFVRGAAMSNGGKSFLCLPSTVKDKDGTLKSTITAALPPGSVVTTPRADTMYVVTEHGVADLFNKPIEDRIRAMISIAHPDFREQLLEEAIEVGLLRG